MTTKLIGILLIIVVNISDSTKEEVDSVLRKIAMKLEQTITGWENPVTVICDNPPYCGRENTPGSVPAGDPASQVDYLDHVGSLMSQLRRDSEPLQQSLQRRLHRYQKPDVQNLPRRHSIYSSEGILEFSDTRKDNIGMSSVETGSIHALICVKVDHNTTGITMAGNPASSLGGEASQITTEARPSETYDKPRKRRKIGHVSRSITCESSVAEKVIDDAVQEAEGDARDISQQSDQNPAQKRILRPRR